MDFTTPWGPLNPHSPSPLTSRPFQPPRAFPHTRFHVSLRAPAHVHRGKCGRCVSSLRRCRSTAKFSSASIARVAEDRPPKMYRSLTMWRSVVREETPVPNSRKDKFRCRCKRFSIYPRCRVHFVAISAKSRALTYDSKEIRSNFARFSYIFSIVTHIAETVIISSTIFSSSPTRCFFSDELPNAHSHLRDSSAKSARYDK